LIAATHDGSAARAATQHNNGSIAAQELALSPEWSEMHANEHFVQFYENDTFLLRSLAAFVGAGLAAGEAVIVITTQAHRAELEARLLSDGVDVAAVGASGQYAALDAAETLSAILVDDWPEPVRLAQVLGDMIARATQSQGRVRMFGGMVALLWAEGQQAAALRLEELWNGLHATHSFCLFCAYPMAGFVGEALARPLDDVCAGHSRVIPAESYSTLADSDDRLRAIIQLQQKARSLEAEIAERRAVEDALRSVKAELEIQVEDLRRLHEMSVRLTSTLEVETVLREVLQAALAVQGSDLGLLSLCDPARDGLTLKASSGFDDAFLKQVERMPPGGGACGTCYQQRRRVVIEDVETDPIFALYRADAQAAHFRACHSTPLMTRSGTIMGVLSVHFRQPHRPSEREIRLMDLYARMAADCIENAQLHRRVQQDLEAREQLLAREHQARAEAQAAVRLRDVFLSVAAHELKTPLTSLFGNAQLLQRRAERDGMVAGPGMKAIGVIVEQARRLNKMVLALLDVSRIETGRLSIEHEPVDLCMLARRVVDEVQPSLAKHTVECHMPAGALIVEGDEARLEQVLQNLMANAIKYSPRGGPVVVRVERSQDQARMAVTDVGIGIPAHDQPHLFQRFYRASNADTQYISGMGIGLYVAKEIVAQHGGTVEVDSSESAGSTFAVCLPLRAQNAPA
jgi:signal transduction histidine kinase